MVLGFTTMPFAERNFWDELGSHLAVGTDGVTVLADRFRILLRHLEFATKIFNQKGVALGSGAIEGAEIEEDSNRISFPDLSLSILFPENSDPHSRQALEAVTIMNRQNSSYGFPHADGQSGLAITAHFLSDASVKEILRSEKKSGKGVSLLGPAHADVTKNAALKKETAFQKDQESVARMLVSVLCSPADEPPRGSRLDVLREELEKITSNACTAKAIAQLTSLITISVSRHSKQKTMPQKKLQHSQQRTLQLCADFVLRSLRTNLKVGSYTAQKAEDHLLLTACILSPAHATMIYGPGLVIRQGVFSLPPLWKLNGTCPFLGQQLPDIVVKHESDLKGVGTLAAQRIAEGQLVLIYIGEFELHSESRPVSRMIVKHTCTNRHDDSWAYCFGIEDLAECIDSGPALGPYANAPGPGEKSNCTLDKFKSFRLTDERGREMIGYPMFSSRVIESSQPMLWTYPPEAGCGKNLS